MITMSNAKFDARKHTRAAAGARYARPATEGSALPALVKFGLLHKFELERVLLSPPSSQQAQRDGRWA